LLSWLLTALTSSAGETALSALRALPQADARNLVRIAARDGLGSPEHWYFTVYDPGAPAFLRVLVVAKGEVVTSQDVSPTEAAGLSKELLDRAAIKVDSDQAAEVALSYAAANQVQATFLNYELARQGAKAVPVWVVTCLDQNVRPLGSVVITASQGNVVASEGFLNKPGAALASQAVPEKRPAIDPRVMMSDQEFLAAQTRGSSNPPTIAEPPAPSSEPESWTPPARESKLTSRGKATPSPSPRVASRIRGLPPETMADVTTVPDLDDDDDSWDPDRDRGYDQSREERVDRPRRRSEPVHLSPVDELPRKVQHIRRFIHRLLPF
jgi:hypothetical protein